MEVAIWVEFLLALFGRIWSEKITGNLQTLFGHSVKQSGLGLWIPNMVADQLFHKSCIVTSYLAECLEERRGLDLQ